MREIVYSGGRFVDGDAQVSLFDRGYLLGDGLFETVRAVDGAPLLIERHLDRLFHGAAVLGIAVPEPRDVIAARAAEAAERTGAPDVALRITLSRGPGPRGVGVEGYDAPALSIAAKARVAPPAWAYEDGVDVQLVTTRRIPRECMDSTIKHANYLPQVLARRELRGQRALEGVMCAVDGRVASGIVANLFAVYGRALRTPSLASGCLPGITRALVLECAARVGLVAEETTLWPADLRAADELFFTSTLVGCLPARRLDDHPYARGPWTRALAVALDEARGLARG